MRRSHLFAVIAILVLSIGTVALMYGKVRKTETAYAQIQSDEQNTRLRYGKAINEIATIQDSLNAIVLGEHEAQLIPSELQSEMRLSETHGDEALARIAVIKAGIERTKARIEELDRTLKRNGVQIAGLEKMLVSLRRNVARKEAEIARLTFTVDTLETRVTGLTADVEDKRRELGTIYYTMGTKNALKESGVIVATGGVLGVGKTLEPSKQLNEAVFIPMDTDQQTVISIPAKKAQIVSAQPVASYVLESTGENQMELRIIDPKEFRKVKHLVIVTA
jgi:peptidoglycan hydrolase CwlO-like protein